MKFLDFEHWLAENEAKVLLDQPDEPGDCRHWTLYWEGGQVQWNLPDEESARAASGLYIYLHALGADKELAQHLAEAMLSHFRLDRLKK